MKNISPILLPLWNPDSRKSLENLLIATPNISLTSTLTLKDDGKWVIDAESPSGAFSIKLMDAFDPTKISLNYGRLTGPEDLFDSRNILKVMQERAIGSKDNKSIAPNNVANDLLEFLPPEAVSPLVLAGKGIAYFEMPFVTPFPIRNEGRTVNARLGLVLDGASNSAYCVWRPMEDQPDRKVLWSERSLSKQEADAIRGHSMQYNHFTLASLASANQPNGKISNNTSLLFSYAEPIPGGDQNIHSRGLTIGGTATGLRMAIKSHIGFKAIHADNLCRRLFGSHLMKSWETPDQKLHENPWESEEDMNSDLAALPEVRQMIEQGTKPYFALRSYLDDAADYRRDWATGNLQKETQAAVVKPMIDEMEKAGMGNFAQLVFTRKRVGQANEMSLGQ